MASYEAVVNKWRSVAEKPHGASVRSPAMSAVSQPAEVFKPERKSLLYVYYEFIETDRQIDRHTDSDTQTSRQADTNRHTYRHTE